MAPGGFERYLVDLAAGLPAMLRERLADAYDIAVVGPPPATIR
jgi:hypothetical protein